MLNQIIEKLYTNPRKIFLIDGLGAILSAFLLGVVLVELEIYFGIPVSALYVLASLPIFFAIYDFYCYRKANDNFGVFLKGIALMNSLYCCLSIGLVLYHHRALTYLGWIYILIEIIIVATLAFIELRAANRLM